MKTLSIMNSLASMWASNGLVKFENFNIRVDKSVYFKSSNGLYCSFFHSKDNSFLRSSESSFTIFENSFMNF
jgi:hypothetical protein